MKWILVLLCLVQCHRPCLPSPTLPTQPIKIDCCPERTTVTQSECAKRGCRFDQSTSGQEPVCSLTLTYRSSQFVVTQHGFQRYLSPSTSPPFGQPFSDAFSEVEYISNEIVRIKFDDRGATRYKVPVTFNFDLANRDYSHPKYRIQVASENPYSFRVTRTDTGTIIWDTGVGGLVLSNQFLQIVTLLPSNQIYGFGENLHESFRHDLNRTYAIFSRDQPPGLKDSNLYGNHPFYVCIDDATGKAHGVLLVNSNAMEYGFTSRPTLTYKTIGGILDFYYFIGDSMEHVIQLYTTFIDRPVMPPYWSLGFHLSRYGYNNVQRLRKTLARMEDYRIPLDVSYVDIDSMQNRASFTVDEDMFPDLNKFHLDLRKRGVKSVLILDPGVVSNQSNYQPYDKFKAIHANIKWSSDVTPPPNSSDKDGSLLGWVWPQGKVIFPDFMHPNAGQVWQSLILDYGKKQAFDGIWLDMNDPANFGTNENKAFNWPDDDQPYWTLQCPISAWDDPPYRTKGVSLYDSPNRKARLSDKTVCMSAVQGDKSQYRHYDVHTLYGWAQIPYTLSAVRQVTGTRGWVLSRSTWVGSGHHTAHWLGDNASTWKHLRDSIVGMLEFNLFGIPMIGADICGFFGDANEELCLRWTQLGAFYPFSRNHNTIGSMDQDPAAFGARFAGAAREILETRYWLLPYLYTQFHRVAHTHGGTVVRALFHEFPRDQNAVDRDYQFMWGAAILVSPIVFQGQSKLSYYLPEGRWYDFHTEGVTKGPGIFNKTVSHYSKPVLTIRGGHVVPMQKPAVNTQKSRSNPFKLTVALDDQGKAEGSLFWDDGVSLDAYKLGRYLLVKYTVTDNQLNISIEHDGYPEARGADSFYDSVDVLGLDVDPGPLYVLIDGKRDKNFHQEFDERKKILKISHGKFAIATKASFSWKPLTDSEMTRIDCWPERLGGYDLPDVTKCSQRHCVWDVHPHPDVPPCFFPKSNFGYTLTTDLSPINQFTKTGILKLKGKGPFGHDFPFIEFRVEDYGENILRFAFDTVNHNRYQPPIQLHLPKGETVSNSKYKIVVTSKDPFTFQIVRTKTNEVIWDTEAGGLVFDDQFLQISTFLPSKFVYGFGENTKNSFKRDFSYKTYPIFSRDLGTTAHDTLKTSVNHYGTHPFYTCLERSNMAHGVLFFNSDPQDYTLSPRPMITYRAIGGRLDFLLFLGPGPEEVIKQYHQVIGFPMMPPYWGLGFALSKYGYNNLDNMKAAVSRTRKAGIPLDILYGDIDHFEERKDFTYDKNRFNGLPEYFKELKSMGMKTIIILDPAIVSNYSKYDPYNRLSAVDGNVHWPKDGQGISQDMKDNHNAILGWVWPQGKVVFPDFFNNNTVQVWVDLIKDYHDTLPFDALWIDMNEPTNFGTNEERAFNWPITDKPYWTLKCPVSKYDDPPYRTGASFFFDSQTRRGRLSDKTICMSAVQGSKREYRHYDVHNLYGHSHALATRMGLDQTLPGQRSFIVCRSTVFGSGSTATHWLGDNYSGWDDLRVSIIGLLDFNLFGFPFTGADICGHFGNATSELCKRWMQLGAFYGYCRNHNAVGNRDQDPGSFDDIVSRVSREALETRYWLLPYLYTLYHQSHVNGGTVLRPLHHQFVDDMEARSISTQFMWGPSLLISPIMEPDASSVYFYLPESRWYDFYTGRLVSDAGKEWHSEAVRSDSRLPLHVAGGSILPMQKPALNTTYSRLNGLSLVVALDDTDRSGGKAEGTLFWDDGTSKDTYKRGLYCLVTFKARLRELKVAVAHNGIEGETSLLTYDAIHIWGVGSSSVPSIAIDNQAPTRVDYTYDNSIQALHVTPDRVPLRHSFTIAW